MKVPVSIPIGGKRLKILYPETLVSDGVDSFADVTIEERTIRISATDHDNEREVFESTLHELTHYALHTSGLAELLGKKLEEAVCIAIEEKLGPVLAFNSKSRITFREVEFPGEE